VSCGRAVERHGPCQARRGRPPPRSSRIHGAWRRRVAGAGASPGLHRPAWRRRHPPPARRAL